MKHLQLDQAIREKALLDPAITHALAYGSFTQGLADQHSDLEYFLFTGPGHTLNGQQWLASIEPLLLYVENEFGTPNALTATGIRVELHIEPDTELQQIRHWPAYRVHPERMCIKDQDGQLMALLRQLESQTLTLPTDPQVWHDRALNGLAFTAQLLARGERYRAWEVHSLSMGTVLRFTRLVLDCTQHWLNASRRVEQELPDWAVDGLDRCTGPVHQMDTLHQHTLAWTLQLAHLAEIDVRQSARDLILQLRHQS